VAKISSDGKSKNPVDTLVDVTITLKAKLPATLFQGYWYDEKEEIDVELNATNAQEVIDVLNKSEDYETPAHAAAQILLYESNLGHYDLAWTVEVV
jgi:hypothetical protein